MSKIEDLETRIKAMAVELAELKKETVIAPVFPGDKDENHENQHELSFTNEEDFDSACLLGLTYWNDEDRVVNESRMQARAYVIEAINQANKGDNGFKHGEPNNLMTFNHDTGQFGRTDWGFLQYSEDCLYIRSIDAANDLLKCDLFQDAYKKMLGVEL